MANGQLKIDPSKLRPGTVDLRRVVLDDRHGRRLVRQIESWHLHQGDIGDVTTAVAYLLDPAWPPCAEEQRTTLRELTLAGAVTLYFRCFDSDARHSLQAEQVFRDERDGLTAHRYWKKLRDGTFAHDSNPWIDSQVLAEVGADGRALGTYLLAVRSLSSDEAHLRFLGEAAAYARGWVVRDLERLQADLHEIVTRQEPAAIAALPTPVFFAPGADKAGDRR
jgi:hypothetical protein